MTGDPAYLRVVESIDRLEQSRRRAESTTIGVSMPRRTVTMELLARLAESARASPELCEFARRVVSGDSTWDRIEVDAKPVPPEVYELRDDPRVDWPSEWPLDSEEQPFRIQWQ